MSTKIIFKNFIYNFIDNFYFLKVFYRINFLFTNNIKIYNELKLNQSYLLEIY